MKPRAGKLALQIATVATALLLIAAVAVLSVDWAAEALHADAVADKFKQLEETARKDPAQTERFDAEVERRTGVSLARDRRREVVSVVGLVAAGLLVVLLKAKKSAKPLLPRIVAEAIVYPPEEGSPEEPSSADLPASGDAMSCTCTEPAVEVDLAPLQTMVDRIGSGAEVLIPLLHAVNDHYRYLPQPALVRLGEMTGIPQAQIAGVASFYNQFRMRPRGEHVIRVCRGTACHVAGSDRIEQQLRTALGIPEGGDTDADATATVESIGCLGCCTLAPVLEIDGEVEGHVTVDEIPNIIDWNRRKEQPHKSPPGEAASAAGPSAFPISGHTNGAKPRPEIRVGLGSCCVAGGSRDVMESLEREIARRRLDVTITPVGCVGICHLTPLVEVMVPGAEPVVATQATPADVRRIMRTVPSGIPWLSSWAGRLTDAWQNRKRDGNGAPSPCQIHPLADTRVRRFVDPQVRIVTEHSGEIAPSSLEQYRERGGFAALDRCVREENPEAIVDMIGRSGLRGRGGGGYPTADKWRKVQAAIGEKYVVCNGDEGDPGAFMDRMIMESYPYRVLEGLAIAACAVGAGQGKVYIRHEYPLAVERMRHAIDRMTDEGLLGDNILGSSFSLHIEVVEGAGAFVCGEETALLQSLMGRRGIPQHRPPYPVERGLFDRPTLVGNVETLANVAWIIRQGPERFAALGTATSKGTKVFSLAGKVRRGGLIEVPMGITIRQVVEEIGGGVAEGKRFKAVQIGGPSGGCVPAELADTPIDYEHLRDVHAIMGSGGLVVLDDDDCMVDVARYFLAFTQHESCGHCTFCRVGTRKLLNILERLCEGKGRRRDLDEIESLSRAITMGSLCGLGKTAPNPVLSTLKYFRDEYEAHLEGRCPAGRCKALIRYEVTSDCVGCTLCAQHCPVGAIPPTPYRQHVIDADLCTRCDACRTACPEGAIVRVPRTEGRGQRPEAGGRGLDVRRERSEQPLAVSH